MVTYILCGIIGILLVIIVVQFIRQGPSFFSFKAKETAERTKKTEYYDDNRSVKLLYECIGNKKDGKEELYYPSGKLNRVRNWNHGILDGEMIVYFSNGSIYIKASYKNGALVGDYTVYRENGDLLTIKQY